MQTRNSKLSKKKARLEAKVGAPSASGSFESDKVPGYVRRKKGQQQNDGSEEEEDTIGLLDGVFSWLWMLPVVRKHRIEPSGQATLEPPPRETSPTYSGDYHSRRRLPGNKRSLAMERQKKGQQQNEGSEEEEEYSDEYEDVDLLQPFVTMSDSGEDVLTSEQGAGPAVSARVAKLAQDFYDEFQNILDQFGPDAVQSLAPLVVNVLENLDNALGESENNDRELVELNEKYKLLEQQYEKERQRRREAEEVMEAGPVPLASDVAEETVDEDLLQQLCYMATGIKQLLISPDGGTFKLGSGDASLVFPPGAVEKETFIRYAIILHGPFVLPAGYKPGSVGVYLNMDGSTLVKPVQLFLCHWCIKPKEDDVTLKFIRAPHTLEVGVQEYTYEELEEEADFTTYTNVGVLTIREPRCLYCVETKVETIAKYSAITLTRNVPSDETLFFRIQLMCDSLEWNTKLTGLLDVWGWKHGSSGIVPRFSYSSPEMPIKASAAESKGLGWMATIEGQHQVKETDFLMPKGKSKSDMEDEVNSGRFPPCLCYKILFTSPEKSRVKPTWLKVDLLGADVDLTFSCTFKEELKQPVPSPVSSGPSLTPPSSPPRTIHHTADVIRGLTHQLDAKWREFGTFLNVRPAILDVIGKDRGHAGACMMQLVEDWVVHKKGTGDLPRTWTTVVQAVKDMGEEPLAQQLAERYIR